MTQKMEFESSLFFVFIYFSVGGTPKEEMDFHQNDHTRLSFGRTVSNISNIPYISYLVYEAVYAKCPSFFVACKDRHYLGREQCLPLVRSRSNKTPYTFPNTYLILNSGLDHHKDPVGDKSIFIPHCNTRNLIVVWSISSF